MTAPPMFGLKQQTVNPDYARDNARSAFKGQYRSSHIFDLFKTQPDQILGNLTTSQYMGTLDNLLYTTLGILIDSTNYVEQTMGGLIAWSDKNFRRRIGSDARDVYIPIVATLLISPKDRRLSILRSAKLDRGILISTCVSFKEYTKTYAEIQARATRPTLEEKAYMGRIESSLHTTANSLVATIANIDYMLGRTLTYRGAILSKYYRLAILAAKRDYEGFFNCRVSLDDMCPDYVSITGRAIDRCDDERGPLTSHIQSWFMTARTFVQKKYDYGQQELSHDFDENEPQTAAAESYDPMAASADSLHTTAVVRFLARIADPEGTTRKDLCIDEYLLPHELELIKQKTVNV